MTTIRNMDDAPRDGTRIIALCYITLYRGGDHERCGTVIEEIYWGDFPNSPYPRWMSWRGNRRIRSTAIVEPIVWFETPKELVKIQEELYHKNDWSYL